MGAVRLTGGAAEARFLGTVDSGRCCMPHHTPASSLARLSSLRVQTPSHLRYLVSVGKTAEAEAVLQKVSGEDLSGSSRQGNRRIDGRNWRTQAQH